MRRPPVFPPPVSTTTYWVARLDDAGEIAARCTPPYESKETAFAHRAELRSGSSHVVVRETITREVLG